MKLDRKDFTYDNEYDPLNPTQSKQKGGVDIQLQAQKHYMDNSTSVGGQIWSPEL